MAMFNTPTCDAWNSSISVPSPCSARIPEFLVDLLTEGSGVDGLSILQNPRMSFVQSQLDQWDVVAGEAG
jgi:hypothetical protein